VKTYPWFAAVVLIAATTALGAPEKVEVIEVVEPEVVEEATPRAVQDSDGVNTYCPVMPDQLAIPEQSTVYKGKTVRFCCDECLEKFKADPEKYMAALSRPPGVSPISAAAHPDEETASPEPRQMTWRPSEQLLKRYKFSLAALLILALFWLLTRGPLARLGASWRGRWPVPKPLVWLGLAIAADFSYVQMKYVQRQQFFEDAQAVDKLHFATFYDYGYPPVPFRPAIAKRLESTWYRGNDERSAQLFNGGFYRTSTFELSLIDSKGAKVDYGAKTELEDLRVHVVIRRAPNTPDFFFEPRRMAHMFATKSSDKFLGRDRPVADRVPLSDKTPMWAWEFDYPAKNFKIEHTKDGNAKVDGIFYICERKVDRDGYILGARFHYAVQFELASQGGTLASSSDLWMGSLYRTRKLPVWKISSDEWFSHNPIPVIPGKQSEDPTLLGIDDYTTGADADPSARR
jgi:hypothetical protein